MIPEYSDEELQTWLEAQQYELARFGPLNLLCQRLTEDVPEIIQLYMLGKNSLKLGEWIYFYDFGKVVRTGDKLKENKPDPDKEIVLIRTKSNGATVEFTRKDLKLASGEAEILSKPQYPIFTGDQ